MTPRGGARPGSGPKPRPENRGKRIMIYFPRRIADWLEQLPAGKRSETVSRAVLAQIERESAIGENHGTDSETRKPS